MAVTKRLADGSLFAGYRIVRPIGRGSMGTVYLGEPVAEGARVALKVLDPDALAEPRARRRFEREASASDRIADGHVVRVLAAGIDEPTGLAWLSMEWLRGRTLAALLDDPSPPIRQELGAIVRQLFDVIALAHRAGVVHRDLKPENVFVVPDPSGRPGPFVKVLDFGIAKLVRPSLTSATTEGLGTPLWVAPEQARAGAVPGPAADVWALALVVFRALTGKLYWRAASEERASVADLALELLRGPTAAASVRAAELGRADCLPEQLDPWFARALAREPADRFPDAGAAWQALEPLLPGLGLGREDGARPNERRAPASVLGPPGWLKRARGWLTGCAPAAVRVSAASGAVAVAAGCVGTSTALPSVMRAEELALFAGGHDAMAIVETDPRAPAPASVLRRRARPADPTDPALAQLVERMRATLDDSGGVGLAAPQVGVSRRVILVRHGSRPTGQTTRVAVYINPRIEWASQATDEDYEACLSMPGVGGLVPRAREVRLRFQQPGTASEGSLELSDWDARIVQHELDHLDGVLYVDRLRGALLSQDETKRLRDEGHRARGWLPPAEHSR